jgi:hypothetical protein
MFSLSIGFYLLIWLTASSILFIIPELNLGNNAASYYSNIIQIISSFTTAILCWRTIFIFKRKDPMRSIWLLIGIGVFSWCIGEVFYAGYIFINDGAETPFPWYSDIGFLMIQPFIVLALFKFIKTMSIFPPIWGIILALMVLMGALFITFELEYASLLQSNNDAERLAVMAYMLFDPILIATTVLTASLLGGGRLAYPWWFCSAGLSLYYASNLFQLFGVAEGTYVSGTWTDLGWPLSFALIGVATMLVYNMLHSTH